MGLCFLTFWNSKTNDQSCQNHCLIRLSCGGKRYKVFSGCLEYDVKLSAAFLFSVQNITQSFYFVHLATINYQFRDKYVCWYVQIVLLSYSGIYYLSDITKLLTNLNFLSHRGLVFRATRYGAESRQNVVNSNPG